MEPNVCATCGTVIPDGEMVHGQFGVPGIYCSSTCLNAVAGTTGTRAELEAENQRLTERLAALEDVVGRLAASDPLYEAPNGWFCAYCDAPGSEAEAIRIRGPESWPHHTSCSWLAARRLMGVAE